MIARLKELMGKATEGPWTVNGEGTKAVVRGADATIVAVRHRLPGVLHEANAALIVALHNCADELLRVAEAAEFFAERHGYGTSTVKCECPLCAALAAYREKEGKLRENGG